RVVTAVIDCPERKHVVVLVYAVPEDRAVREPGKVGRHSAFPGRALKDISLGVHGAICADHFDGDVVLRHLVVIDGGECQGDLLTEEQPLLVIDKWQRGIGRHNGKAGASVVGRQGAYLDNQCIGLVLATAVGVVDDNEFHFEGVGFRKVEVAAEGPV